VTTPRERKKRVFPSPKGKKTGTKKLREKTRPFSKKGKGKRPEKGRKKLARRRQAGRPKGEVQVRGSPSSRKKKKKTEFQRESKKKSRKGGKREKLGHLHNKKRGKRASLD